MPSAVAGRRHARRQLALAEIELAADATLIDLDEPRVLAAESLRPSIVASGQRSVTQGYAVAEFQRRPEAAGLRWWSTLEASWIQVTLFDRALSDLRVSDVRTMTIEDDAVTTAATYLGLL